VDNIQGVNDPSFSTTVSEWQPLNLTATYISGTSFSVTGDQTLTLQVNRRLRSANTGGTAYSTITNSVYSAGVTTVTVSNDAVPLDSGLNSIYYALLAANNPSLPAIYAKSGLATASGLTMNTARMLGRTTAGVGAVQELDAAAVAAFTAAATTGAQGAVRLATTAEAAAGTAADRALTPAALRGGPIQSMVRLQNHAGYGSTNTVIRRFTNVITNVGSDITYADSATLGGSFTIVNAGVYAITTTYSHSADTNQGISVNSAQLTTDVSTITAANRLVSARDGAASGVVLCSWTGYLSAGDVIRAHGDAAAVGNAALATFTITRIA